MRGGSQLVLRRMMLWRSRLDCARTYVDPEHFKALLVGYEKFGVWHMSSCVVIKAASQSIWHFQSKWGSITTTWTH